MLQTTSNAIRQQVMNHEGEGIFMTRNLDLFVCLFYRAPAEAPRYVQCSL